MRLQSGPGFCGPAAVVNCLRAIGIRAREAQVAVHAGTTAGPGTTEHGLKQAIERFDCKHTELSERKYSIAEESLFRHLKHGPAVILAEEGDHWVSAIGLMGDRVVVFDSQTHRANKLECGIHILQRGDQLRRYWLPCESKRYAILITGPAA